MITVLNIKRLNSFYCTVSIQFYDCQAKICAVASQGGDEDEYNEMAKGCLWVFGVIQSLWTQRGIRPHCLQRFLLTDSISRDDVSKLKLTFCLGGARAHRHTKTQLDTNMRAHNIYKYGLAVLSVFCSVINTGQKWSKNTNMGSRTQLSSTGGRIWTSHHPKQWLQPK